MMGAAQFLEPGIPIFMSMGGRGAVSHLLVPHPGLSLGTMAVLAGYSGINQAVESITGEKIGPVVKRFMKRTDIEAFPPLIE
jgi:hypothetical protein